MKILLVICLCLTLAPAWAASGRESWTHSNMKDKVRLLREYKSFFHELNKTEGKDISEFKTSRSFNFFMNEAWADANMDCIYAGWPSRRVNNSCSSPQRHNPDYKNGSCGKNEMQCQPLFFGKGLCVSVASKSQRSLAFTNCDKKSTQSPDSLIREIRADGNEALLFELMDFADKICKDGAQAGTGMCKRLQAAVERMRPFKTDGGMITVKPDASSDRGPAVVDGGKTLPPSIERGQIVNTVKVVTDNTTVQVVSPEDCEIETEGTPFDRAEPRDFEFEYMTSRQGADPAWEDTFLKDKREEGLRPHGFELRMRGPNEIAGDPIDPREYTERQWRFVTNDNSKRESYLWITDDAGSGYLSQLMESIILIVPRKMKQTVEVVNGDLHVTLPTGEKVIYDKQTRKVKGGVLTEGKIDLNPDRFKRKFAPISYSGTGISIRVDKRGEDPRLIPGKAVVTQNGKTCSVPARDLWTSDADFKYADDEKLVAYLNSKCGKKFNL